MRMIIIKNMPYYKYVRDIVSLKMINKKNKKKNNNLFINNVCLYG